VLLVADHGYGMQTAQAFAGWAPAPVEYQEWAEIARTCLAPMPLRRDIPAQTGNQPATAWETLTLPRTDWPWFRAACRDALTPREFRIVDDLYVQVVEALREAVPPHMTDMGSRLDFDSDRLREVVLSTLVPFLESATTRQKGAVVLRATQAALIPCGLLVRAELDPFLQTLADTHRPPSLTAEQWQAMRAYRDPWRPMACALQFAGMPQHNVYSLTMEEMRTCRTRGDRTMRGVTVAPEAWEYVLAHYLLRITEGARDLDPLLGMTGSALSYARRHIRNDFGIAYGAGERSQSDETLHETWLRTVRRRIVITDIR
jgi:hypothetical protein